MNDLQENRSSAYFNLIVTTLMSRLQDAQTVFPKIKALKLRFKKLDSEASSRHAAHYAKQYNLLSQQASELLGEFDGVKDHRSSSVTPGQSAYLMNFVGHTLVGMFQSDKSAEQILLWAETQKSVDFWKMVHGFNSNERFMFNAALLEDIKQEAILYSLIANKYNLNFVSFLYEDHTEAILKASNLIAMIERERKGGKDLLANSSWDHALLMTGSGLIDVMDELRPAEEKLRLRIGKAGEEWQDELWNLLPQVQQYLQQSDWMPLVLRILGS